MQKGRHLHKELYHRHQGGMNPPSKSICLPLTCRDSPDVGPDTERRFRIGEMAIIQLIHTRDDLGRALVRVGIPLLLARDKCTSMCVSGWSSMFLAKAMS